MSDYSQATFFGPKDSLTSSDPLKIIRGTEVDAEFLAIANAISTKVDSASSGVGKTGTSVFLDVATVAEGVVPVVTDKLAIEDVSSSSATRRVTIQSILDLITFPSNAITAGLGFDGDGDTTTLVHDWSEFPEDTGSLISTDFLMMYDAGTGTERRMSVAGLTKVGRDQSSSTYTILSDDCNRIIWWSAAGGTVTLDASSGKDDCEITIISTNDGTLTLDPAGSITVNNNIPGASEDFVFNRGASLVLRRLTSASWFATYTPRP